MFALQDSIDLLLGNYVVEENEGITAPSPLRPTRDMKFTLVSKNLNIDGTRLSESLLYVIINHDAHETS